MLAEIIRNSANRRTSCHLTLPRLTAVPLPKPAIAATRVHALISGRQSVASAQAQGEALNTALEGQTRVQQGYSRARRQNVPPTPNSGPGLDPCQKIIEPTRASRDPTTFLPAGAAFWFYLKPAENLDELEGRCIQ
jgi:hypothetical protein